MHWTGRLANFCRGQANDSCRGSGSWAGRPFGLDFSHRETRDACLCVVCEARKGAVAASCFGLARRLCRPYGTWFHSLGADPGLKS